MQGIGYKTITGAIIKAIGVLLGSLGEPMLGDTISQFGESIIAIGIGHKLVKLKNGLK